MQIAFRWYGRRNGQLSDIQQISGVEGIVWALHDKMPGEIWQPEEIAGVKKQLDEYGFNMDVVESVNIHDGIKAGLPTRDFSEASHRDCDGDTGIPGIIKPLDFIHEVTDQRFPNPFVPDTPQRIASDISQKIPIGGAGPCGKD